MGTFISILLDILSILAIIVVGSLVVVLIAELILRMIDKGNKAEKKDSSDETKVIKDDEIVVYSDKQMVNTQDITLMREEVVDGEKVQEVDFDKAVEEQKKLQQAKKAESKPAPIIEPKVQEKAPSNEEIFWEEDEDDEFKKLLDEVIADAKKAGEQKEKKETVKPVEEMREESKNLDAEKKAELDAQTQKELEELKALKEQHQKEIEEFKQMKEDFVREKEEQLQMLKDDLNKAKEEEIERIRQEALKEQAKIEEMQDELEEEKFKIQEEKDKLKEESEESQQEPIIQETIIKDEEELNKLKYKNLLRMNSRLSRIIKDTERLQDQKQKAKERLAEQRRKILERQEQEKLREQERQVELERQEQERQKKLLEAEEKRNEITRKLSEASKKASKYKLDSKIVKITNQVPKMQEQIIEERIVTTTETIPDSDTEITTVQKTPLKASAKPMFAKEYYETKLIELEEELREAEKELRANKAEYIPLTRIHKAYERDSAKLRKKEMQVAKQKVALYGVNSKNIDPAKKQKLDENLQVLAELKDSVQHCEEVIKKNKDRYPIIEKNNKLLIKQIERINDDVKVCEKALDYYKKNV